MLRAQFLAAADPLLEHRAALGHGGSFESTAPLLDLRSGLKELAKP
jgi:hypothetical protein